MRGDARPDRGDARALPGPVRLLPARGRARAADRGGDRPGRRPTRRTGTLWARTSALRRREGPAAPALRRRAATCTSPPTSPTCATSSSGFDRAIYVLGADHHGYVARLEGGGGDARLRPARGSRCCSTSSSTSPAAGEQTKMSKRRGDVVFLDDFIDEVGVDFARWFLVDRGHDQTIEIDVDLAAEKSRKNPVYYVQYVHARISGIFREAPAGAAASTRVPPRSARSPEERELDQAAGRVPGGRARGDRAARRRTRSPSTRSGRRRLPPLLPRARRARPRRAASTRRSGSALCRDTQT